MTLVGKPAFDVIGRRIPRQDGREKVTGIAKYVADISVPGMLHGAVLRSPFPHARILRIDTSRAVRLPGVRAVITAADTSMRPWGQIVPDQHVLAVDRVRYVGEEVAAVAAVDAETAQQAADLIEVEYEELPAVFDPIEAMAEGAPLLHEERPGNIAQRINVQRGDVDGAFATSHLVIERDFQTSMQWPGYIEPMGTLAEFDQSGRLTVWAPIQTVFRARDRLATVFGLNVDEIRVVQTVVGGGFGGKVLDDNNTVIAVAVALRTRKPVRVINSREDDFVGGRPRIAMRIHAKMGFEISGRITAKHLRLVVDNGAYCGRGPALTSIAAFRHDTCYQVQHVKVESRLVYTNKIPTGSVRGFGGPHAAWAVEQMLDIAAEELGLDPADVARINAAVPGYVSPHGNRVNSCELLQCIDRAEAAIGWRERRAKSAPGRGVGMACGVHVAGKRQVPDTDASSAIITMSNDGKALVACGEGEIGQGITTIFAQIAAEAIGLPVADVRVGSADTETSPFGYGAFASRLTFIGGNAVRAAGEAVRNVLAETAADLLEANPEDVEIRRGVVSVRGSGQDGKTLTVRDVVRHHFFRRGGSPVVGFGTFDPDSTLPDQSFYCHEAGAYGFTCHAAEVEVDPDTGEVRILEYVAVSDCGTVLNPIGAEGQVEGSFVTGLGFALREAFMIEGGRVLNPNFSDYKLTSMADIPPLHEEFADSYEEKGPFGAKGVGELACDPVAPTIANAIYDAVGVRVTSLPITAEKVLAAIRARSRDDAGVARARATE